MATRVAVFGFGAFGSNHARVYQELPDVDLAAIVETDPQRQAEARRLYPKAQVADYLTCEVDAASVAVPTESHAKVAEELLIDGVPCLVEKPLAGTRDQANKILTISRNVSVPVFVGQLERFNPALRQAAEVISEPRFVEIHRLGSFSPRSLDIDVVLDLMVHDLDILLRMAGSQPDRVEAIGVNVLTPRVDIANARLTFPNGMVANVTASRVSKEKIRKLRIFQPQTYISVDFAARTFEHYRVTPPTREGERPGVDANVVTPPDEEPLRAEIEEFLRCATTGEAARTLATAEEGAAALELALRVMEEMGG